jgi:hypothetical protein
MGIKKEVTSRPEGAAGIRQVKGVAHLERENHMSAQRMELLKSR